mmetsp:Transcript_34673/g.99259  ORF Transcript_34673/g.99259 Transcript_34673/m.99259 type:complete len:247 (-) Transcript_34673:28-768(-)
MPSAGAVAAVVVCAGAAAGLRVAHALRSLVGDEDRTGLQVAGAGREVEAAARGGLRGHLQTQGDLRDLLELERHRVPYLVAHLARQAVLPGLVPEAALAREVERAVAAHGDHREVALAVGVQVEERQVQAPHGQARGGPRAPEAQPDVGRRASCDADSCIGTLLPVQGGVAGPVRLPGLHEEVHGHIPHLRDVEVAYVGRRVRVGASACQVVGGQAGEFEVNDAGILAPASRAPRGRAEAQHQGCG